MSRSGYMDCDDYDQWAAIRWGGAINSAMNGARGQMFLRRLLAALDAMPIKRLIKEELIREDGEVCALGCLAAAENINVGSVDPEDYQSVAGTFQIAEALAREIVYQNDEGAHRLEPPEFRFRRMREWVARKIKP